jgi:hypothetical protein
MVETGCIPTAKQVVSWLRVWSTFLSRFFFIIASPQHQNAYAAAQITCMKPS